MCRSHIPCYFIIAATEQEGTAQTDGNGTNGTVIFKVIVCFTTVFKTYFRSHSYTLRIHFKEHI